MDNTCAKGMKGYRAFYGLMGLYNTRSYRAVEGPLPQLSQIK